MEINVGTVHSFDWDNGNRNKNYLKHGVTDKDAEQVFLNEPLLVYSDTEHSKSEKRWECLGKTNAGRLLFTSFTFRRQAIRVISSRDMNKKERTIYRTYEEKTEKITKV